MRTTVAGWPLAVGPLGRVATPLLHTAEVTRVVADGVRVTVKEVSLGVEVEVTGVFTITFLPSARVIICCWSCGFCTMMCWPVAVWTICISAGMVTKAKS